MKRMSGFTLIELVSVMLIVAILAAVGLPSFNYVTSSNRVATEVNSLVGDLQYARSEAVREGSYVTVCASVNGTSCTGMATWNTGWIVFADPTNSHTGGTGTNVLRVKQGFNSSDTFAADNAFSYVTYNREGFGPTGVSGQVTITLHNPAPTNSQWTRCVQVSPLGQIAVVRAGVTGCS